MSAELLSLLVRCNLVLAAAIVVVLAIRAPVRAWFGARIAYALWLTPLLAAATCFLPALNVITVTIPAENANIRPPTHLELALASVGLGAPSADAAPPAHAAFDVALAALAIWFGGVLISLTVLGLRQWRFVRTLGALTPRPDWGERVFRAETDLGPALVGVLKPMIVAPADFDTRYSTEERRIVIAHERAHMAQGDPLFNACAMVLQCVGWFNPLLHVAANALRTDQELACDAAVLARGAPARPYAEALIKASTAAAPVPLGCAWPAPTPDAFKKRILMLKRAAPSRAQALLGAAVIAIAAVGVGAMSWAAQPARVVTVAGGGEAQRVASEQHELMGAAAPGSSEVGMQPSSEMDALEASIEAQGAARESLLEHLDAQREARDAAHESRQAERESELAARQSALAAEREAFFRSQDTARQLAAWDRDLAARERETAREDDQIARERAALDADLAAQEREIAREDRQIARERAAHDAEMNALEVNVSVDANVETRR